MVKVFSIISTIVLIVLIIIVVVIFVTRATGGVPEMFGYQIFRVQTGSMAPTAEEVGDVILSSALILPISTRVISSPIWARRAICRIS